MKKIFFLLVFLLLYITFIFLLNFFFLKSVFLPFNEKKGNNIITKNNYNFITGIQFFAQAPFGTKQNWEKDNTSCEEATIGLYVSWLKNEKTDKQSFDDYLQNAKKFQVEKFGFEPSLSGGELIFFVNSYFTGINAKLIKNLTKQKISWFLEKKNPIIIGINSYHLNNPYYHWSRYHTLLIVGENKDFYIVKDVGTKRGNNFMYLKPKILEAIKETGNWGVVIKKGSKQTFVNIPKNYEGISSNIMVKDFYDNLILDKHTGKSIKLPKDIKGGVLSHHSLVAPLFDNYFRLLKKAKPNIRLFVVGGTNHFTFDDMIRSTNLDYITPYGKLKVSNEINNLLKSRNIKLANNLLKKEHSIFTITPFIKKYYPKAEILPFIVNNEVSPNKLDSLKIKLKKILSEEETFYIQSTDFSHYIPDDFRNFYDLYSKNILDDWDFTRIENMWIDGRKLMYLTINLLGDLGYKKVYHLFNTSSNKYLGVKNVQNTSYFFSYIGKGEHKNKSDQVSILFGGDMILNFLSKFNKKCNIGDILCFQQFGTGDQNESVEDFFFKGYDLIVFNTEGNFGDKTYEKDIKGGPIYFKYNKKYLTYFKNKLKVEALFFSNNHQRDFGFAGIEQTFKLVKQAGLKYVGNAVGFNENENIFKKQILNKKVIIINLNDVVSPLQSQDLKKIEKYLKSIKNKDTLVFIYIHRGREYFLKPTKRQIELGHKFIDWGADLVVGSHSHTIQPMEVYKGKRIYYGLGNITYDNDRQKKVISDIDYGLFVGVNIDNNGTSFFYQPYKIEHKIPRLLVGKRKDYILEKYGIFK